MCVLLTIDRNKTIAKKAAIECFLHLNIKSKRLDHNNLRVCSTGGMECKSMVYWMGTMYVCIWASNQVYDYAEVAKLGISFHHYNSIITRLTMDPVTISNT